jgi:putative glutamine amidotransferase
MNIAISQTQTNINDVVYDCLDPRWYNFLYTHNLIPIPNIIDVDFSADMLILTGGENTPDRLATESALFNIALEKNIPILGVCRGAFVLNEYYNGMNRLIQGHSKTEHVIEMEDQLFTVNSFHSASIYLVGDDIEIIATADVCVEAFKHRHLPIWGLSWHPERMEDPVLPKDLKDLLYG